MRTRHEIRPATVATQEKLGFLVGVTRDSIRRWELARVPRRPMALVVWAQTLGYSVEVRAPVYLPGKQL